MYKTSKLICLEEMYFVMYYLLTSICAKFFSTIMINKKYNQIKMYINTNQKRYLYTNQLNHETCCVNCFCVLKID